MTRSRHRGQPSAGPVTTAHVDGTVSIDPVNNKGTDGPTDPTLRPRAGFVPVYARTPLKQRRRNTAQPP